MPAEFCADYQRLASKCSRERITSTILNVDSGTDREAYSTDVA